jgi:predicted RNA-binding Zn-ribbon protein involved in translation (DUF1610 family)
MKYLSDFNNHPSKCVECGSEKSPKHTHGETFQCVDCGETAFYKAFQLGVGHRMSETVPNSCPYYKNGTTCDGNVTFKIGQSFGVCDKCGRDIPLILEM